MNEPDLDRPVTLREFNERFDQLIKRFDKLDEERAEEKKEREEEKKERTKEKLLLLEEKEHAANERTKAQKEWDDGNMVEWLRMYFKIHKGDDHTRTPYCLKKDK